MCGMKRWYWHGKRAVPCMSHTCCNLPLFLINSHCWSHFESLCWGMMWGDVENDARAYISAYYSLNESQCNGGDTQTLTLPLIEHIVKAFKTHRAAIDWDSSFMNGFVHMFEGVIMTNAAVWGGIIEMMFLSESCFFLLMALQLNF